MNLWDRFFQRTAPQPIDPGRPVVAVGVDLGKQRDPSAIVVAEYTAILCAEDGRWWEAGSPNPARDWIPVQPDTLYTVRTIDRLPLGTSYPEVARRIVALCRTLRQRQPDHAVHLLMDQTGVGRGPVDMVRAILPQDINLTGVTFTGTDRCDPAPLHRQECSMGKAYMVIRLQTALQKRLLQLPKGEMARQLVEELLTFEVHTTRTGHDQYGAFAVGTHDDLVCALGLAILGDLHADAVRVHRPGLYG